MRPLAPSLLLCLLAVSTAAADARSDFWAWYEPLVPGLHAALTGVRLHVTRYEGGEGVDHDVRFDLEHYLIEDERGATLRNPDCAFDVSADGNVERLDFQVERGLCVYTVQKVLCPRCCGDAVVAEGAASPMLPDAALPVVAEGAVSPMLPPVCRRCCVPDAVAMLWWRKVLCPRCCPVVAEGAVSPMLPDAARCCAMLWCRCCAPMLCGVPDAVVSPMLCQRLGHRLFQLRLGQAVAL